MTLTANLALPLIAAGQAQKHVTHNEAIFALDTLVQLSAKSRTVATPPTTPQEGDRYLLPAGATNAWAGKDGKIAALCDGVWTFIAPRKGFLCYVEAENRLLAHDGATWVDIAAALAVNNVPAFGVNATADTTNRLTIRSNAALATALETAAGGTGDIRFALNKEAAGKTCSFLYQDNWSGRAEMGLMGSDDFAFKVSPDGSTWSTGLTIRRQTGVVAIDQVELGTLNGGAIGGLRNRLLNAEFGVWQRGASFGNPANGTYVADRWKVLSSGAAPCTVTIAPNASVFDTGFVRSCELAVTAVGVPASGTSWALAQLVEGVELRGRQVTVSARLRASAAMTFGSAFLRVRDGSGVTATAPIAALGTAWQTFSASVTLSSTFAADTVEVAIVLMNGASGTVSATGSIQIQWVQLEVGPVATPFETIGARGGPAEELRRCQRYYCKSYEPGTAPGTPTVVGALFSQPSGTSNWLLFRERLLPTVMRATPTVTLYSPGSGSTTNPVRNSGTGADLPATQYAVSSTAVAFVVNNATVTVDQICQLHFTAAAEL